MTTDYSSYFDYTEDCEESMRIHDKIWNDSKHFSSFGTEAYSGASSLRNVFIDEGFDIKIVPSMITQLVRVCNSWEIRGQHAEALNSAMVGLYSIHFLQSDANSIFDVFNIDRIAFDKAIKQYPGIPKEFKVASDNFNLLCLWATHLILKSALSESTKKLGRITLFKMLHYKFYTSVVNHNFPHGATEDVMQYVVDNLNAKFDIKNPKTPTWKLVIEDKSDLLSGKSSIHRRALETFAPDNKVTYCLTDVQTRIRSTLVNSIIQPYYKAKELNNKIGSYNNVQSINGERTLRDISSIYDSMITGICAQVVNVNKLVNNEYIHVVVAISTNISESMLRQTLVAFSNIATQQIAKQQSDDVSGEGNQLILIGYRSLITNIIQKSYRDCINSKINISSPLHVFEHIKNIYRSSRVNDPDILLIKRSVEDLMSKTKVTTRESTLASLKIAFIIYILLLSFDYMK